jgi:nucleolar GTP-binding protein
MCTVIKKLNPSFGYLEEVRKHLARLPTIDPSTRTLIITGFPNVGKSSLMNNLTNAKVDVQPYPFTTQSLFVGHTVYKYVPWQVLDTPGILDHPLEQRNTIEMQAITALAHLNACILYVIDISETCGYFIDQQISLFQSIKPLFKNKPMVVVLSKMDLKKWDELTPEAQNAIQQIGKEQNAYVISMSNKSKEGINDLKAKACDILLEFRFTQKSENSGKMHAIENRLHVAMPQKRDDKERPAVIPESVVAARQKMNEGNQGQEDEKRKTIKDVQEEKGGAGVYYTPLEEHFKLEDEEWKYDAAPEIFEGKNIADFIDPEIEQKLLALEKEEEILEQMDDLAPVIISAYYFRLRKPRVRSKCWMSMGEFKGKRKS